MVLRLGCLLEEYLYAESSPRMRLVPRLVECGIMISYFGAYESWWAEDMFDQLHCPFWSAVELPCTALKEEKNIWGNGHVRIARKNGICGKCIAFFW